MGLQKTIQTSFGIDAIYWRVSHFTYFDDRTKKFNAEVHGFQTKADSDAGHNRIHKITISVQGDEFTAVTSANQISPRVVSFDTMSVLFA